MISVVIPSFNRAQTILSAVNSVLIQTYKNIELLVIDDASSDNTKSVISGIHDNRLRYIRLEHNSGACAARNRGIQEAKGKYIAFNDSDDQWHMDKLEKQLTFLQKTATDITVCKMACFDGNNNNFLHNFPESTKTGLVTYTSLLSFNLSSTQTMFGKTACFKDVSFDPDMPRLQDWDIILRLAQKYTITYQNEILVNTFIQPDSISTHPEKGVDAMERLLEKHREILIKSPYALTSFCKKKAAFVCKTGYNPIAEMKLLLQYNPSLLTAGRYILARTGLYLPVFKLLHRF